VFVDAPDTIYNATELNNKAQYAITITSELNEDVSYSSNLTYTVKFKNGTEKQLVTKIKIEYDPVVLNSSNSSLYVPLKALFSGTQLVENEFRKSELATIQGLLRLGANNSSI
jgi:hypothetical protein